MSYRRQKYQKANADSQFVATDAYITKILTVQNPVLRALINHAHQGYCDVSSGRLMQLEEAQRIWRQDPRFIDRSEEKESESNAAGDLGGQFEDDAKDVDAYISEVMLQESHSFNADQHDWYQRHKRAVHVRAAAIVTYNNNRQSVRVVGDWPTLSRAVKLHIRGHIDEHNGQMQVIDTTRKGVDHGIELARVETVKGNDFHEMLIEKGMHRNEARMHLLSFFGKPSTTMMQIDEPTPAAAAAAASNSRNLVPVVFQSRQAYQNAVVAQQTNDAPRSSVLVDNQQSAAAAFDRVNAERERQFFAARDIVLPIGELWQRIVDSKLDQKKFLETEFVSLSLRMVLLSRELNEIKEAFESSEVQLDAVARGVEYIHTVVRLMREQPDVLCFHRSRRLYGEQANVRTLQLLPDLSLTSYIRLRNKYNLPRDIIRETAVDIYNNILRYDVYGNGKPPTERSFSTGNMFSVFGAPESERNAEYYHGTADYRRDTPDPLTALRQRNTMAHTGRFAFPDDASAPLTLEIRQLLMPDVGRLDQKCTSDEFVQALRWMIEKQIVVRERFTGVGPTNKGRPVDAIFITEVHEVQERLVAILSDIYRRGVKQSMHHSPTELADGRLVGLYDAVQKARTSWREDYVQAVQAGAQDQRTIVTVPHNDSLSATTHAIAADAAAPQDTGAGRTLIAQLARRIAREEAALQVRYDQIMVGIPYDDTNDAYSDARRRNYMRRMPLLLSRLPPFRLQNGRPFAEEQIEAIKRIRCTPVTVTTGRGGVGKSELLTLLTLMYPVEQIAVVAFTGQVASEVARRTNFNARTIHSMLFRHTRYLEARYRAAAYRKHAIARSNRPPEQCGEAFDLHAVENCKDDRELRAYVEYVLDSYPPLTTPFETVRFLAIDEMTLLSAPLLLRLLEAAHCPAQGRFLERVALFGDLDQLPSIGYGNASDFANGLPTSVCRLDINHRSEGEELFALAEAIATHKHTLPMPKFDQVTALREIRRPDGARIVALHTMAHDLTDKLKCVITALGAVENEETRAAIQCIATTNDEVTAANAEFRWQYFGKPRTEAAIVARRSAVQLIGAAPPVVSDEERERIAAQIHMRVYEGDRIYLKENSRQIFKGRKPGEPDREKHFYNSRLLQAQQFYNGPKKMLASIKCRCGLCPPPPQGTVAAVENPCMQRLDLVPPGRQRRTTAADAGGSNYFEWHDQYAPKRNEPTRRMAVFRDESGTYTELDISRMMQPRSKFDFGFALTTHRMQGSQQRIIIYILTRAPAYVNWKPIYTAATRAQLRLIILSSDEIWDQGVRRKDPIRRSMIWSKLFDAVKHVLDEFPDSPCSVMARATCPEMFDDAAPLSEADRWNVFEKLRYEPRRAVAVPEQQPAIAAAPEQPVVEQPTPALLPDPVSPPPQSLPFHLMWRARIAAADSDDDEEPDERLYKRRKNNEDVLQL